MKMNMLLFFLVSIIVGNYAFAKDNLAILPFTGGQGEEGETIAELFSFDNRLNEYFIPIPRTSVTRAIRSEQGFQMTSGMTDPDTISSIGQQLGAQYVVAGNITSVGRNRLLIISIMDIRNLQQIAGDYITFNNIEDIRGHLSGMVENIIEATRNNTTALPKLAIVPVQLQGGADPGVADNLAQLLAINLIRNGIYAVYPRTKTLDQVMDEHNTQASGITADTNVVGIGYGENPDLVLSVIARRLGNINMFNAVIIDLTSGVQVVGRSVEYNNIDDGMSAMTMLSNALTGIEAQAIQRTETNRMAQALNSFWANSGLGIGVRVGYSFEYVPVLPINNYLTGWDVTNKEIINGLIITPFLELKLGRFFSVQAELDWNRFYYFDHGLNTSFSCQILRIPILAKGNISVGNFLFSPFAGLGFNIPMIHQSFTINNDWSDLDTSVNEAVSLIFGIDAGV